MSPTIKTAMERTIVFSIAAVYMLQQLTGLEWLAPILGSLVVAAILLLMPKLKGMTLWLTISFMAIGAALMFARGADLNQWFEAAAVNVTIVTLFLFAPLFGIPVRLPAYVDALKRFFEASARSRGALLTGAQMLTQVLGVFLNVGAIPVVYGMIYAAPQPGMERLIAGALNRGFAGAIFWSPYFAAMTIITSMLGLGWSSILPYVLGLAAMSLLASWIVDRRELKRQFEEETAELHRRQPVLPSSESAHEAGSAPRGFPRGLGLYLITAMIVILVLERAVQLPMVMLICFSAIIVPLAWCMAKRAAGVYVDGLKHHVAVTFPALQKEITLFMAAGFFSGSIGTTGFGAAVPAMLEHVPLPISITFSIFAVALIAGTALIGLHPIVPVTILAGGIDPASVGISSVYFAVLLLGSWGLSNPISPVSAVNNLLAGLMQRPVFEMARANFRFAGFMAVVLVVYLAVVGLLVPGS